MSPGKVMGFENPGWPQAARLENRIAHSQEGRGLMAQGLQTFRNLPLRFSFFGGSARIGACMMKLSKR